MRAVVKVVVLAIVFFLIGFGLSYIMPREGGVEGGVSVEHIYHEQLKFSMILEKVRFKVSPREPVKIICMLTNIGERNLTLTFHSKTKFDFFISAGASIYRNKVIWAFTYAPELLETTWEYGEIDWSDSFIYSYDYHPTIETIVLRPGEGIVQVFIWNQDYYDEDDPNARRMPGRGTDAMVYAWPTAFEFFDGVNLYSIEEPPVGTASRGQELLDVAKTPGIRIIFV